MLKAHIIEMYPTRAHGAYYIDKFILHLKTDCDLSLKDYLKKFHDFNWPKCKVKDTDLGYKVSGKGVTVSLFAKGAVNKENCPSFKKGCEKLSKDRMGENNPMYGKESWNKGLDKSDERVRKVADKRRGQKTSEATKKKQSEAGKKREVHGHTGHKHSDETKKKLRENTARLWSEGRFKRESSIHVKMRDFLAEIKEDLVQAIEEEYQFVYYSFDFAFPEVKVAIECQGSYFHIDPRIYPNGPKTATQRRNFGRDKAKKKFCVDRHGWKIIEIWEPEINDGSFKEDLKCKLLELNIIKKSE